MILVIDTATRTPTVALADKSGALRAERQWLSQHRHDEELLDHVNELLAETGLTRRELIGVVAGTGPGSFTGLRIGLATAKTIAYALGIPLCGISTTLALALAARRAGAEDDPLVVTLPAGAADRYVHRVSVADEQPSELEPPQLTGDAPQSEAGLVAIDFDRGNVAESAARLGSQALAGLAASLASLGAQQLAGTDAADPADLVPAYVALPRGLARAVAEMEWSPDLR